MANLPDAHQEWFTAEETNVLARLDRVAMLLWPLRRIASSLQTHYLLLLCPSSLFTSGARVIYPAGITVTAPEIRPQSYLHFAFDTCISDL